MKTLLPKQELRHLKHEYRLRFLILFTFFLSGAVWIGIISLFPSYIFSVTQEHNALNQASKIDLDRQTNGSAQIAVEIKNANSLTTTIASTQDSLFFSFLIEDIDSRRLPDMVITSMTLSHTGGMGGSIVNGSGGQSNISITGNAATRDILVAFEKNLQNDPRLTKVSLPVSDLAQNTNINFTITMSGIQ